MSASDRLDSVYEEAAADDDIQLDDDSHSDSAIIAQPQQQQSGAENGRLVNEGAKADEQKDADSMAEQDVTHPDISAAAASTGPRYDPSQPCAHCGKPMGCEKGPLTKDGPLHIGCVLQYKFLHQPRCHYCDIRFLDSEATKYVKDEATSRLYHSECRQQALKGVAYVRPSREGEVRKFAIARSKLSRHNWKTRFFILSPMHNGIHYFEHNPMETANKAGGADSSSSGDDTFAADAKPKLTEEHVKKAKGLVPLDHSRARLITHPSASVYRVASSDMAANEVAVIFFDGPESNTERRLLFQCKDAEDKKAWVRALEGYIHTVDDPKDYGAEPDTKK